MLLHIPHCNNATTKNHKRWIIYSGGAEGGGGGHGISPPSQFFFLPPPPQLLLFFCFSAQNWRTYFWLSPFCPPPPPNSKSGSDYVTQCTVILRSFFLLVTLLLTMMICQSLTYFSHVTLVGLPVIFTLRLTRLPSFTSCGTRKEKRRKHKFGCFWTKLPYCDKKKQVTNHPHLRNWCLRQELA